MTRFFAILILLISDIAYAKNSRTTEQEGGYELFTPPPPPRKYIEQKDSKKDVIKNRSQYDGDHGFLWYQKNMQEKKRYISFDINYSFVDDFDVKVNQVSYPDAAAGNAALGYSGTADAKGALGFGIVFGYEKNDRMRYELEFSESRMYINKFTASGFSDISLDGGNYTEVGPEALVDENDVLKTAAGTANILINLSKNGNITPYIGAGYGYSMIGVSSEYDIYPVIQIKAGFVYKLSKKMKLIIGFKQMDYGDVKYPYYVEEDNAGNANYSKRKYILEHELKTNVFSVGYKFDF